MKKEILNFLIDVVQKGEPCALAVVVESSGHSPGREGFSMVITPDSLFGTIGGGTIEKNMVNKARKMLARNETVPELFHRVHKISAGKNSSGMICGGTQTIALHPIQKSDLEILTQCIDAFLPNAKPKTFCLSDIGIQCLDEQRAEQFSFVNFRDSCWAYEEIIGQKDTAYIFGGGHVCLALSQILATLGFHIVVLDERPLINTIAENKHKDELIISPFEALPDMIKEGEHSYAFIMTPSHIHDETVLRVLLGKKLKYLGMMASKTKTAEIFARLREGGFSEEALAKVHSPIGLPIRSKTPEEIAISIVAEVIQTRNSS